MKKQLFLLIALAVCWQSCTYKRYKINRTVSKTLDFTFNVNQTGDSKTFRLMAARDIIDLFDKEKNSVVSAEIKSIDIKSVLVGASVAPSNTAQQVTLSADVLTGALLDKPTRLLNDTKTIKITASEGLDLANALGAALGVADGINLHNALSVLNATGAAELKKALSENLQQINRAGFSIRLNSTVPANQRLVMTLTLKIDASITYTRCEEVLISLFGTFFGISTLGLDPTDEC